MSYFKFYLLQDEWHYSINFNNVLYYNKNITIIKSNLL